MKKLLLSFVALISLLVPALIIAETSGGSNANTINFSLLHPVDPTQSGYTNRSVVVNGQATWSATGCNLTTIDQHSAAILNGKTSAVGTLTSPILEAGVGTLSFSYTNPYSENHGVSLKIELVKEDGTVVKTETLTKSNNDVTQNTEYTASFTFDCPDKVKMVFTNLSPSNSDSNKDRVAIWNLQWTNFTAVEGEVYFSPAAGDLYNPAAVALSTKDESAKIFYTTDGTDPTDESTEYTAPIEVNASMTIKAKIEGEDNIYEASYTCKTATPIIENAGTPYSDHTITLTSETIGASIYYTTDGTEPTDASTVYNESFTISEIGTTTVRAIAVSSFGDSEIAASEITISPIGAPVFTPAAGTYSQPFDASITSSTSHTSIYYTLDGSEPSAENGTLYENPFKIEKSTTVKAIAVLDDKVSEVITTSYKIDNSAQEVTFDFKNFNEDDLAWAGISEMPKEGNNIVDGTQLGWVVNEFEKDGLTVLFDNVAYTTTAKHPELNSYRLWWTKNGIQLRLGKSGANDLVSTMTFNAPEGSKLTTIVFTGDNSNFSYYASKGKIDYSNSSRHIWTWTGVAESVVFTPHDFGGTMQLTSIEVTCSESNAPVFNYETGKYYETFKLTMTTDLPGGAIYYTTDGSDPTAESTLYTEPFEIEKGEVGSSVTVKAIAAGKRVNPITNQEEDYISEITEATYTWEALDEPDAEIVTIDQLIKWFTTAEQPKDLETIKDPAKIKWEYPNIDDVIEFKTGLTVTAVTPHILYLDDTFNSTGEINSIALTSSAVDFTELYEPGNLLENLVVGFQWLNPVTPALTLKGTPVDDSSMEGNYEFVPQTATVDEIIASAEWNSYDIYLARENNLWSTKNNPKNNMMVPEIELANPLLVSRLVAIEGLNITKDVSANMAKTIPCVSADGKTIDIITEINLGDYSAGKYDIEAIVAYNVEILEEKTNKDGEITQEADTTITPYLIPVKLSGEGGEVTKATFTPAEEVADGYLLLIAEGRAMTALAYNKSYGYAPATKVTEEDGEITLNIDDALRIIRVSDGLSRAEGDRFYLVDSYGRYFYQTGTYNSFNVAFELPEEAEEAMWTFEPVDDEDGNTCMKVTNVATGKWIQYSAKYGSWGSYPEEQESSFLPVAYQTTTTPSAIVEIAPAAPAATTEIYDLRGIRVGSSIEALTPGLYIIRRGTEVSKILVK